MFHHLHLSVPQHEECHKPDPYTHTHTQWEKWKSGLQVNVCNVDMTNWEYNALECSLGRDLHFIVTWEIHFTKIIHRKKTINEIPYNQSILYVHHETSLSSAR